MERANDKPKAVQIEIRAAEIAVELTSGNPVCTVYERGGLGAYAAGCTPSSRGHAGWLAREIMTHNDREYRDADAWPWDPSRPVAGQYEEWLAKRTTETP